MPLQKTVYSSIATFAWSLETLHVDSSGIIQGDEDAVKKAIARGEDLSAYLSKCLEGVGSLIMHCEEREDIPHRDMGQLIQDVARLQLVIKFIGDQLKKGGVYTAKLSKEPASFEMFWLTYPLDLSKNGKYSEKIREAAAEVSDVASSNLHDLTINLAHVIAWLGESDLPKELLMANELRSEWQALALIADDRIDNLHYWNVINEAHSREAEQEKELI